MGTSSSDARTASHRHGGLPMRTAIVIPARYGSTRLPGKPLLRETGKYLIQHVYEQAREAKSRRPGDRRHRRRRASSPPSRAFGGTAVMTRGDHPSGTDRVAEVAAGLDADVVDQPAGRRAAVRPGRARPAGRPARVRPGRRHGHARRADPRPGDVPQPELRQGGVRRPRPGAVLQPQPDPVRPRRRARTSPPTRRGSCSTSASTPTAGDFLLQLAARRRTRWNNRRSWNNSASSARAARSASASSPHAHRGVDTPADYAAFVAAYRGGRSCRAA